MLLGLDGFKVLNEQEISRIVEAAAAILDRTGVLVENDRILEKLGEWGGRVDKAGRRVYFDTKRVETFLQNVKRVVWGDKKPRVSATVEIYQGFFLDPVDNAYKGWDEAHFMNTLRLAKALPHISGMLMLGCPLKEAPVDKQPLYERLYCWKYGITPGGSIWDSTLCESLYALHNTYAEETGKPVEEVFHAAVYLISPLKFAAVEAEQFLYFYERGLKVGVGANGTLGGSFPVTVAGALAVHLAENLFIGILNHVFFGTDTLHISTSITAMDMSSGALQYGRPEKSLANIAMAQIARSLGAGFNGHCGLSDAKQPGCEAGMQKLTSAFFNAAAGGDFYLAAGLLATDEVLSPIQMIFDHEALSSVAHIFKGIEADPEALGLEAIFEEGPGGSYLASEHTAFNFREALWVPSVWSKAMYGVWEGRGRKNDLELARERYLEIIGRQVELPQQISGQTEQKLLKVIHKL